jgi:hypothetical protein
MTLCMTWNISYLGLKGAFLVFREEFVRRFHRCYPGGWILLSQYNSVRPKQITNQKAPLTDIREASSRDKTALSTRRSSE